MYHRTKEKWDTILSLAIAAIFASGIIFFAIIKPLSLRTPEIGERIVEPNEPIITEHTFEVTAYCDCEKCCGMYAEIGYNKDGDRITAS